MIARVALVAICFSYASDRRLRLPAVLKDLQKVLSYAAWLEAKVYLVSDFDSEIGGPRISERLGLSVPAPPAGELLQQPQSRPPARREAESTDARRICALVDRVCEPYIIAYYSGHATNKSLVLPDESRLPIVTLQQHLVQSNPRSICWIIDACELSGRSLRLPFLCREDRVASVSPRGLHLIPTVALSSIFRDTERGQSFSIQARSKEGYSNIERSTNPSLSNYPSTSRSRRSRRAKDPAAYESDDASAVTESEGGPRAETRSFATDDNGSLFTSLLFPLLISALPTPWPRLLGSLSRCCGYKDGQPVCLKLCAYLSDATLTAVPLWMRKKAVDSFAFGPSESSERQGSFWIVRR